MPSEALACGMTVSSSDFEFITTVLLPMGGASCEYGGVTGFVLRKKFCKRVDGDVDMFLFEDVWRKKAEHGVAGAVDDDLLLHKLAGDVSGKCGVR